MKTIGILKESNNSETRVAITPDTIKEILKKHKVKFLIEKDAGLKSGFSNHSYQESGAHVCPDSLSLIKESHTIFSLENPGFEKLDTDINGKIFVSNFAPYENLAKLKSLQQKGATVLSLELIPRTSKAQSMDVLSSQANIAGYMAVLMAANKLGKIFPMMMTAAGTIKPAQVMVLGAGVMGLSAISTAKRLGAVVHAYDVRDVVKEQVLSLGAKFVKLENAKTDAESKGGYAKQLDAQEQERQRKLLTQKCQNMDVIITTALIPGKPAPLLLDQEIFSLMKPNTVIVDGAAISGGNVPHAKINQWEKINNVWLYGADSLARLAPIDASQTYSTNMKNLLLECLLKDTLDFNDEILSESIICHQQTFVAKQFANANS